MTLYTVHFATQHMVSKFDDKGKKIADYTDLIAQTITALPYATAMQYKDLPNFVMEPYTPDGRESRTFVRSNYKPGVKFDTTRKAKGKPAEKKDTIGDAARTGDMSAAINAGA